MMIPRDDGPNASVRVSGGVFPYFQLGVIYSGMSCMAYRRSGLGGLRLRLWGWSWLLVGCVVGTLLGYI